MKVTQEIVTVWAEPETEEVNILLGGLHVLLDADETALLVGGLAKAVERLRSKPPQRETGTGDAAVIVRKDEGAPSPTGDMESMQLRTRALIQASIRDKGLSLREEPRS